MSIGVVVVSDRGDLYLPGCLDNLAEFVPELEILLVDDEAHLLGMAGAVRRGMEMALEAGWDYVLWVEEDFRFNERPPIEKMKEILDLEPTCTQVVLKRQPWSVEEHEAGGLVELNPDDYYPSFIKPGLDWLRHTRIFSLNPCLIPRWVLELGYPDGNEAEQTERLVARMCHFAIYGKRDDPPLVHHEGHVRGNGWRL